MSSMTKFWLLTAYEYGWGDLIETLGNIIDTSEGANMRSAIDLWCQSVADRFHAIPPDLDDIFIDSQFGTEL